jgi:hypothetical protein
MSLLSSRTIPFHFAIENVILFQLISINRNEISSITSTGSNLKSMGNPNHLVVARKGRDEWAEWRKQNPEETTDFSDVNFTLEENQNISFKGFDLGNPASFRGAVFGDEANFEKATISASSDFSDAIFGDNANFQNANFGADINFSEARFGISACFKAANFGAEINFTDVVFGNGADFEGTKMLRPVIFTGATFQGVVRFDGVAPPPVPRDNKPRPADTPSGASSFGIVDFSDVRFIGSASFEGRKFDNEADFSGAQFDTPPNFRNTDQHENLNWAGVKFAFSGSLKILGRNMPVSGWKTDYQTITDLRRLRGIAKKIYAIDAERDLFILERQAERGVFWYDWWRGEKWPRLVNWWRPLPSTVLMFLYAWSSDCGRSLLRPLVWLVIWNWAAYELYSILIDRPLFLEVKRALFDLAFSSIVPFGATARSVFKSAVDVLFLRDDGQVVIPMGIQVASSAQGIINLVLVFLLGLALRNYFKLK